jgi:hypothetical protein
MTHSTFGMGALRRSQGNARSSVKRFVRSDLAGFDLQTVRVS